MKYNFLNRLIAVMIVLGMMSLSACGREESAGEGTDVSAELEGLKDAQTVNLLKFSDMFTDRDMSGEYKVSECIKIELNGNSVICNSKSVQVEGETVTITEAGTYLISGMLENGSVVVDAGEDSAKVQLVLDGVNINHNTGAAIYVKSCDKIFVTVTEGSENCLSNGGEYEVLDGNNIDGVVFSKSDICFNGSGSLIVTAKAGHGIVTKDDLKITSGVITVNAAEGHGLAGKDSVRISGGRILVVSGKDGIRADNEADTSKGYIYIAGGDLDITSGGDGLAASGSVQVDAVDLKILAGGGNTNKTIAKDENGAALSTKGMKVGQDLVLNDGAFIIDAQDDALHSNCNLTVNGGTYELSTGDDGLHADENTVIAGGTIHIVTSYEGIEGNKVYVSGGYVKLLSEDDGMNAAGGNDGGMGGVFGVDKFGGGMDSAVEISGGTIYMNTAGDGLDSNGSLVVTGGVVYLSGPTNGANGALDYTTTGQAAGGTVVALGSAQMAMNFDDSSTQGSVLLSASGNAGAGTEILVRDADGNLLIEYVAESAFNSVLITSPKLQVGETYTFIIGGSELEMTLETLINGSGGGMGGPGSPGGRPGGMGGHGGPGSRR